MEGFASCDWPYNGQYTMKQASNSGRNHPAIEGFKGYKWPLATTNTKCELWKQTGCGPTVCEPA